MSAATIVWFRQDLRLADHPALHAAAERGGPVIPVYLWVPGEEGDWPPGSASRWWLHQSLESLARELDAKGSRIVLRKGADSLKLLRSLIRETGADAVFWSRRYEPAAIDRDKEVKQALKEDGLRAESYKSSLLFEPWEIETASGGPYQVFTPFSKQCFEKAPPEEPLAEPRHLPPPADWPRSLNLEALELEPEVDWAEGIRKAWNPGTQGVEERLSRFLEGLIDRYPDLRNRPDLRGVSRLSPHLHHGEASPRQVWHAVLRRERDEGRLEPSRAANSYLRQILWREFGYHLLYHFPKTTDQPLREKYEKFPWVEDERSLEAWQKGRTGYPIVDAAMRELWETGWMHNRARMVVASFLVKDLLIHWLEGARWFWDTLVDADLANNTLGWQWTAGCGADAAPYFRIFNPVSQGERHDPNGDYIRRWIPEIADLPGRYIHKPWEAPDGVLEDAGVRLGQHYPEPIVDHQEARKRALMALDEMKSAS